MQRVLVTGSAGFIGYHVCADLLKEGAAVHGYDAITDYYDVALKRRRHALLLEKPGFSATEGFLEDGSRLQDAVEAFQPDTVVHLAAQAGVRYSLENPRAFMDANVAGTFNVIECAREGSVRHLLIASSSSVYGANTDMPFRETDKADMPLSFYAATKKAGEALAHSYAHLWSIPMTAMRFFTVYGPWGRPDMALFRFADAILNGRPIDLYNHGEMERDFTFADDAARAIRLLIDVPPPLPGGHAPPVAGDSLSSAAPFRVVNIGNARKVRLLDYIEALETALGRPAQRNSLPMHPGDVPATWADASLLEALTGFSPQTRVQDGVTQFARWYRDYYGL